MVSPDAYVLLIKVLCPEGRLNQIFDFFLFFTEATTTVVIGKDLQVAGCLNNF